MRGGEHPEVSNGISGDFLDNFLANSKPADIPPPPSGELHPSGNGTYESHHDTFDAHVHRDGTVDLHDTPDVDVHPSCLFGGCKMAIDDAIMRHYGIDPYARAKLRWLDQTRDERARIGLENRKYDLAHSAQFMKRNLDWLWQKTSDVGERKEALFELWDEVAETGDDDLVQGGAQARAYLIGFVRAHQAEVHYSAEELAQLNAHRQSKAAFAPYDD